MSSARRRSSGVRTSHRALAAAGCLLAVLAACTSAPDRLVALASVVGTGGTGGQKAPPQQQEVTPEPRCGDGVLDAGEACDGADTGGVACLSLGFNGGGYPTCTASCKLDTSTCFRHEDCTKPGDEDGNGLQDCEDPACARVATCLRLSVAQVPTAPHTSTASTVAVRVADGQDRPLRGWMVGLSAPPGAAVQKPLLPAGDTGLARFDVRLGRQAGPQIFTATLQDTGATVDVTVEVVDPPPGFVQTVVNAAHVFGADESGPAVLASIGNPVDLAVAKDGTLYLAEACRLLSVSPQGVLSHLAGTGSCGMASDSATPLDADLSISALALDEPRGLLYVADPFAGRVRALDLARGTLTTVMSPGGPDPVHTLQPVALAVSPSGGLLIGDGAGGRVLLLKEGSVSVLRAPAARCGALSLASCAGSCRPFFDAAGAAFIAAPICGSAAGTSDDPSSSVPGILRVSNDGSLALVAGHTGLFPGLGTPAAKGHLPAVPYAAFDQAGNLLLATGNQLGRVDGVTGRVTWLAGSQVPVFSGEDEPVDFGNFAHPVAVAVGPGGDLYLAETGSDSVRRIVGIGGTTRPEIVLEPVRGNGTSGLLGTPQKDPLAFRVRQDGSILPFAPVQMVASGGGASVWTPSGGETADGSGMAYRTAVLGILPGPVDFSASLVDLHGRTMGKPAVFHLRADPPDAGNIFTALGGRAGTLRAGVSVPATAATLAIEGAAAGADGLFYLAAGPVVAQLDPAGMVSLVAGTGLAGSGGDKGPAPAAQVDATRVAFDGARQALYVLQRGRAVRVIDRTSGVIRTLAGGGLSAPADGMLATKATFRELSDLTVGPGGLVVIADAAVDQPVRAVDPSTGILSTVVAAGSCGESDGFAGGASAVLADGDALYVAGKVCHGGVALRGTIRKEASGAIRFVTAASGPMALSGGNLLVADRNVVYAVDPDTGAASLLAGGGSAVPEHVPALAASLPAITDLAVRLDGKLAIVAGAALLYVW